MLHSAAACIISLRAAMEALVVEVTKNPEIISELDHMNKQMLNVICEVSKPLAAGINLAVGGNMRLVSNCELRIIMKCLFFNNVVFLRFEISLL